MLLLLLQVGVVVTQAVAYGVRQEEEGHGAKEHKENEENEEGSADPSPMGSGADLWLDKGSIFVVAGPAATMRTRVGFTVITVDMEVAVTSNSQARRTSMSKPVELEEKMELERLPSSDISMRLANASLHAKKAEATLTGADKEDAKAQREQKIKKKEKKVRLLGLSGDSHVTDSMLERANVRGRSGSVEMSSTEAHLFGRGGEDDGMFDSMERHRLETAERNQSMNAKALKRMRSAVAKSATIGYRTANRLLGTEAVDLHNTIRNDDLNAKGANGGSGDSDSESGIGGVIIIGGADAAQKEQSGTDDDNTGTREKYWHPYKEMREKVLTKQGSDQQHARAVKQVGTIRVQKRLLLVHPAREEMRAHALEVTGPVCAFKKTISTLTMNTDNSQYL
jgi:hypothetical protein